MSMIKTHLEVETGGRPEDTRVSINGDLQKGIQAINLGVGTNPGDHYAVVSFIEPRVRWEGDTQIITTIDGHEYELRPLPGGPLQPDQEQERPCYNPVDQDQDSEPWGTPEKYTLGRPSN